MTNLPLTKSPAPLGFGLMRLPMDGDKVDLARVCAMVDDFMTAGFSYFDTAWGYHDGKSEETLRKTVVERYPREQFTVATKFPIWAANEAADVPKIFATQLERTGAGYFDYYLIHAIDAAKLDKLADFGVWEFIAQKKAEGLIRHIGFSFHDTAEVLERVLSAHPETELVQLQLNYADWDDDKVQAGACYDVCMKHGVPVVLMEPVKGGSLAFLPPDVQQVFRAVRPDASMASWAMRFCGSLDGIICVLSGMSTEEQMQDNIETMKDFEALTEADRTAIKAVLAQLAAVPTVPCTACKYCIEDCPQQIKIPEILRDYNQLLTYGDEKGMRRHYANFTGNPVKASACIECGVCEGRCPQHIEIIQALKDCVAALEA